MNSEVRPCQTPIERRSRKSKKRQGMVPEKAKRPAHQCQEQRIVYICLEPCGEGYVPPVPEIQKMPSIRAIKIFGQPHRIRRAIAITMSMYPEKFA